MGGGLSGGRDSVHELDGEPGTTHGCCTCPAWSKELHHGMHCKSVKAPSADLKMCSCLPGSTLKEPPSEMWEALPA